MQVVTEIKVNHPEPFKGTDIGAETIGSEYRMTVPAVATEPLVFEVFRRRRGRRFIWTPTESAYGDINGMLDYIAGSAPVSLVLRGREARYERAFPSATEVYVATQDGRKYWHVLYEPPRKPAPYLGNGVWFGVSGRIDGIKLPEGRHESLRSYGFEFKPVYAEDLMGERVQGWYEVRNTDQGQQLFICIPAEWLLHPDRVYPVKLDPTIIVDRYGSIRDGDFVQLPNGALLVVVCDGIGRNAKYYLHISPDGGTTWYTANTSLGGGRLPGEGHIEDGRRLFVDNYGNVFWVYCTGFKVSGTELQIVKLNISGTNVSWGSPVTLDSGNYLIYQSVYGVVGAAGSQQTAIIGFTRIAYNSSTSSNGTEYARAVRLTISQNGAITVGSKSTMTSQSFSNDEYELMDVMPSISSDGTVYYAVSFAPWQPSSKIERTTIYGPSGTIRTVNYYWPYVSFNGYQKGCWLFVHVDRNRADLHWHDVPVGTGIQANMEYIDGTKRSVDNKVLVAYTSSNDTRVSCAVFDPTDVSDLVRVSTSPYTPYYIRVPHRTFTTNVPVIYATERTSGSGYICFDQVVFNTPPLAPTNLTRSAFDAREAAVFTWRHNDPDGDAQAKYQLQIVLNGVTVYNSGEVQSPYSQHLLPGGTLENGRTYQWRVRTADQAGEWSPWSDYAVFQTGSKPVVTILYPTSDTRISAAEVTVQWSVSDQSSAIVRLYDAAGSTVLQHHEVTTPSARAKTITGLVNNQQYQVSVQVTSAIGVQGDEVFSGPFSVQFTPPPNPTARATRQEGFIRISITNPAPTGDEPEVTHNDIYRRELGGEWVRIATGIEPDGTYDDYAVGSGRLYQYRVVAYGSNGAYTEGPQVVEGMVVFPYDIYVHRADDLSVFAKLRWNPEVSQQSRVLREMAEFAGREYPVVEVGSFREMGVKVSVQVLKQEAKQLELLQEIVNSGIGVLYRDHRGRRIWGHIEGLDITDTWYGWNVSFTVDRMDRKEAV